MKRLTIIIILAIMAVQVQAQRAPIRSFYQKYKGMENVENIQLSGWVLKLAATFSDEEEAGKIVRHISKLRVLTMEEDNLVSKSEFNQLLKQVRKDKFEDLMHIREDGDEVQILIREDKDRITDVLLLVYGPDSFTLLSLEGALRLKDLKDLQIDVEGGDHFKRVPEKRAATPRA